MRRGGTATAGAGDATKISDIQRLADTASAVHGGIDILCANAGYGATKAGQLGFMRTACSELAKYSITVKAVATRKHSDRGVERDRTGRCAFDGRSVPLKRLGTVEDVGYAAPFLASQEASDINGQTITVDGGQFLPAGREFCRFNRRSPIVN